MSDATSGLTGCEPPNSGMVRHSALEAKTNQQTLP